MKTIAQQPTPTQKELFRLYRKCKPSLIQLCTGLEEGDLIKILEGEDAGDRIFDKLFWLSCLIDTRNKYDCEMSLKILRKEFQYKKNKGQQP